MLKLLLVSHAKDSLSALASALKEDSEVDLSWAESGKTALDILSGTAVDLVVTDENLGDMTGLEFADKLLFVNPMVNCTPVSSLSPKKFHEASEGLGVIAQLPVQPGKEHAEKLLKYLRQIKNLTDSVKKSVTVHGL